MAISGDGPLNSSWWMMDMQLEIVYAFMQKYPTSESGISNYRDKMYVDRVVIPAYD